MSILHPPGATSGPEMLGAIAANIVANVCSELGKMLEINPLNKRMGERQSGSLRNPSTSEKSFLKYDDPSNQGQVG